VVANTLINWMRGGLTLGWSTQYISSLKDRRYANAIAVGSANPYAGITNPGVPSYWYHHLNASWSFGDGAYKIYGGVRNVFDKAAPLLSSPIEGNMDQNNYDVIGRYFHIGFSLWF